MSLDSFSLFLHNETTEIQIEMEAWTTMERRILNQLKLP